MGLCYLDEMIDLTLLYERARKSPKKVRKEIELLYEEHKAPEVANLLTFIYLRLRKLRKAEALVSLNYERHPDHLISRINYADQLLRQKRHLEVGELFNHNFNLKLLYPDRETFSEAEYKGFTAMAGFYYFALGDREQAMHYHYLAYALDPRHGATRLLGMRLYKKDFFSFIKSSRVVRKVCSLRYRQSPL